MINMLVPPKNCATFCGMFIASAQNDRDDRDDRQENRARQRDAAHGVMQIIAGRLARAHAGNVAAVFLQVVGNLQFIELRGHPEIGEEQNHQPVKRSGKGPSRGCSMPASSSKNLHIETCLPRKLQDHGSETSGWTEAKMIGMTPE